MLLILKLPVETIDPLVNIEPVNVKVSALAENNVVPVDPTKLVEPLTVKDPDTTTAWLSWLTLEAVEANDELTAFNTYDAVVANEALVAKLLLTAFNA